ncbi:MAG TPA: hypothetical protein PLH15_05745 [Spirochaetota bacterium]|nr:hypothetical protein [Spirochaetota bacterium]HQQ23324.1 hypothetical protein [Spirochaetota bacterium]
MKKILLVSLLSAIVLECLCSSEIKKESVVLEKDNANKYYYEMSKIEIDNLMEQLKKLKKGMSIDEVVEIMGNPNYIRVLMKKEDRIYRGQILKYDIKKWKKDIVNLKKDKSIKIYFDHNKKMINYEISN